MAANHTLEDLYNALKADGAPLHDTYQDFAEYMTSGPNTGYDHRKALYDALKADGAPIQGTYNDFVNTYFREVSRPAPRNAQPPSTPGGERDEERGTGNEEQVNRDESTSMPEPTSTVPIQPQPQPQQAATQPEKPRTDVMSNLEYVKFSSPGYHTKIKTGRGDYYIPNTDISGNSQSLADWSAKSGINDYTVYMAKEGQPMANVPAQEVDARLKDGWKLISRELPTGGYSEDIETVKAIMSGKNVDLKKREELYAEMKNLYLDPDNPQHLMWMVTGDSASIGNHYNENVPLEKREEFKAMMREYYLDPENPQHVGWMLSGDTEHIGEIYRANLGERREAALNRLKALNAKRAQENDAKKKKYPFSGIGAPGTAGAINPGDASRLGVRQTGMKTQLDKDIEAATAEVYKLNQAITDFDQKKDAMDKSWWGKFKSGLWNGMKNPNTWTMGVLDASINKSTRDADTATEAGKNLIRSYKESEQLSALAPNPGAWYTGAYTAGEFVGDPANLLFFGAGSAVASPIKGAAAKGIMRAGGRSVAKDIAERYVSNSLVGRLGLTMAEKGVEFGVFEGLSDIRQQITDGGWRDENGQFHEGFSWSHVAERGGHGLLMGGIVGGFGAGFGNVANKAVGAVENSFAKAGIKAGGYMTSKLAEGTIFAAPEIIQYHTMSDADFDRNFADDFGYADEKNPWKKDEARRAARNQKGWDAWAESTVMVLGMDAARAVRNPGGAGMSVKARLDELRGKDAQKGTTFKERLGKMMDGLSKDTRMTKEEIQELKSRGYGKLADLYVKDGKKASEEPTNVGNLPDEYAERVSAEEIGGSSRTELDGYSEMQKLMNDPTVSEATRAKAYYILTGQMLPMSTVMGYRTETDEDGNVRVMSVNADGGVVTSRTFNSESKAIREIEEIERQAELNTIELGEQYAQTMAGKIAFDRAIDELRPDADKEYVYQIYQDVKNGNLTDPQYVKMVEDIDHVLERDSAVTYSETPAGIRERIRKETGINVDEVLKKTKNRTDKEQAALQEYANALYPENSQKAEMEDGMQEHYESGRVAFERMESGDAEAEAELDGIAERMREAYERFDEVFGSDAEYFRFHLENSPWELVNDPELTDGQREVIMEWINAKSAMDGVKDASTESADHKRQEIQQSVEQRMHRDSAVIQPAVLKDGNREVYIVKGNAATYEDGTVDVANSSDSLAIFDPETGEYKIISARDLASLSAEISPQQELKEAFDRIDAEQSSLEELIATSEEGRVKRDEVANQPPREEEQPEEDPVFDTSDKDRAWDGLVEMTGDEESAYEIAQAQMAQAEAELAELQKKAPVLKKPKLAGTPAAMAKAQKDAKQKYQEALDLYENQMAEVQSRLEAWKGITGVYETQNAQRLAEEERRRADEQARIEAEKKERANLKDIDNELAEVYDRVKDNAEAMERLRQSDPETLDEVAAWVLSGQKLLWNDKTNNGVKTSHGLQSETGYGEGERRKLFGLFASAEKGGKTIEELSEDIMNEACQMFGVPYDQGEARNALIDLIASARTPSDIYRYVAHRRAEQALKIYEDYEAMQESLEAQYYKDKYGLELNEGRAYEESVLADLEKLDDNFDEQEFYNYIADEIANQKPQNNDEGRIRQDIGGIDGTIQTGRREGKGTDDGRSGEVLPSEGAIVGQGATDAGKRGHGGQEGDRPQMSVASGGGQPEAVELPIEPTEAQKAAGNYKMEHRKIDGYNISIENTKGSVRRGKNEDGTPWETKMNNDYGYIRGTKGVDGDHIDVFLSDTPEEGDVFVIDQVNADGSFDEHKVMYGFPDIDSAREAYLSNYEPGWTGLGAITHVTKDEFKKWVESSKRKTKPFAEYASVKSIEDTQDTHKDKSEVREWLDAQVRSDSEIEESIKEYELSRSEGEPESQDEVELKNELLRRENLRKGLRTNPKYAGIYEKLDSLIEAERNRYKYTTDEEKEKAESDLKTARTAFDKETDKLSDSEMLEFLELDKKIKGSLKLGEVLSMSRMRRRFDEIKNQESLKQAFAESYETLPEPGDKVKPSGTKMWDFVSKEKKPPMLAGVYHDAESGFAVASDSRVLIADKRDYNSKDSGKIKDRKGNIIEGRYPSYKRILPGGEPTRTKLSPDIVKRLRASLQDVLNDKKNKSGYVPLTIKLSDGKMLRMDLPTFAGFIKGMEKLGATEIEYYRMGAPVVARSESGFVLAMPLYEGVPHYRLDLTDGGKDAFKPLEKDNGNEKFQIASDDSPRTVQNEAVEVARSFLDAAGIPVQILGDSEIRKLFPGRGNEGRAIKGWTKDGKVFLNADALGSDTSLHEYTHMWDEMVKRENPALWNRGKELMKQTPLWEEVMNDTEYRDIRQDEDAVASEVHSRLTGEQGSRIMEEMIERARKEGPIEEAKAVSLVQRLRKWLGEMFEALKNTLGKWSRKDLKNLTIDDFNRLTLRDFAEGLNPDKEIRRGRNARIVMQSNPMRDDYHTGIRGREDVKTFDEILSEAERMNAEEGGLTYPDMSIEHLREAARIGKIKVYSSKPIENGVFVTPSRMNAMDYAGGGRIYERELGLDEIAWIGEDQGQVSFGSDMKGSNDDVHFSFSDNKDEFDKRREEAIAANGTVIPGLADKEIKIIKVPRHDFTGKQPINEARTWAKENLRGEYTLTDASGKEVNYTISGKAIDTYLSDSKTRKSDNLGVHLSVLKALPEVITNSVETEAHPDYPKGEDGERDASKKPGADVLVHRHYGAVEIDGEIYRVKTTILEHNGIGNKPHSFEVSEIETLDTNGPSEMERKVQAEKSPLSFRATNLGNNSEVRKISGRELLAGVEKSYDPGVKLLDESARQNSMVEDSGMGYGLTLFDWADETESKSKVRTVVQKSLFDWEPEDRDEGRGTRNEVSASDGGTKILSESERALIKAGEEADKAIDDFMESFMEYRNSVDEVDLELGLDADEALRESMIEPIEERLLEARNQLESRLHDFYSLNNTAEDARRIARAQANRVLAEMEMRISERELKPASADATNERAETTPENKPAEVKVKTSGGLIGYTAVGHLPDAKTGEFAKAERKFTTTGEFSFTGDDKIHDRGDVAWVMRALEDYAIENTFAVYVRGDGSYKILHIGMGQPNASLADLSAVRGGYDAFGAEKIWFVHNHPSGNLKQSQADDRMLRSIKGMFEDLGVEIEGLIADTNSGRYSTFDGSGVLAEQHDRPSQGKKEDVEAYRMNRLDRTGSGLRVEDSFQIKGASNVADVVRDIRFKSDKKVNYLVLDQKLEVIGNFHTDYESAYDEGFADEMVSTAIKFGGNQVIVYGKDIIEGDAIADIPAMLRDKVKKLSGESVNLLDSINIKSVGHESAQEKSLLEPTPKYGENDIEVVNNRFNSDLRKYIEGSLPVNAVLHLGHPADAMKLFLPSLPIVVRQRILRKASETKHNVPLENLYNLPRMISEPIFVFQRNESSIGILTEIKDRDGKNVCVAIELNKQIQKGGEFIEVNDVRSLHGREIENIILPILHNDTLRYVDKKKSLEWLSSASSNYQQEKVNQDLKVLTIIDSLRTNPADAERIGLNLDSVAKIIENFENPKLEERDSRKYRDGESQDALATHKRDLSVREEDKESKVSELSQKLHTPIRIINNVDSPGDKPLSAREKRAKGWYDSRTGEVVVVLDNNVNVADVENTVVHETVWHKGLDMVFDTQEKKDAFLDFMYENSTGAIKDRIDAKTDRLIQKAVEEKISGAPDGPIGEAYRKAAEREAEKERDRYRREAAEEFGAEVAGKLHEEGLESLSKEEVSWWSKVKEYFMKAFSKLLKGSDVKVSPLKFTERQWGKIASEFYTAAKRAWDFKGTIFEEAEDVAMRRKTGFDRMMEVSLADRKVRNVVVDELKAPKTREEALQRLSELTQPFENIDQNAKIYVSNRDARHSMQFRNTDQIKAIGAIDQIIRNAVKVGEEPVKENEKETTKKVHIYYCPVNIGNKQYAGRLVVKEYYKGNKVVDELHLYNLMLKRHHPNTLSQDGTPHMRGDANYEYKISELIGNWQERDQKFLSDNEDAIRYRDPDMSLEEMITKMKVEAAQANTDNLQAKREAMRAIGGNLNKLRQAMARQREYDITTVKSVTDLAKVLMDNNLLDDLSKFETKRILSAVGNVVGRQDVSRYVQKVMDIMVDNQLRLGANALSRLLTVKGSKVDARGIEVQGELDPDGQTIAKVVRKSTTLPKDDIENRISEALNRMGSSDRTIADEATLEYAGLQIARQYAEDITESKAEERDLRDSLKQAKEDKDAGRMTETAYRQYVDATMDAIRQNKIERAEAFQSLVEQVGTMMSESIERAKAWREAQKIRVEEIQHNANSDMEGRPTDEHHKNTRVQKVANNSALRFLMAPLATFDQMLRMFGNKSARGEGYLWNRYMRGWVDASEKEYKGYQQALKVLDEKVSEVFGPESGRQKGIRIKKWGDLFTLDRNLPKGTVTFWDGGEMKEHVLTQGNLLYIYMADKMSDGRMKLRRMGITEEDVADIADKLDPRFIELADWMQEEFLVDKRNEYNEVHKRMFGASMAAIENYFPLKILANARMEDVDISDSPGDKPLPATSTGSIIKRRRNNLALDVTGANAFSVILDHLQQMERWAAFAEFNRDLNTLLSYKRFRNQVMNMSSAYGGGKMLWNNFRNVSAMAAGAYRPPIAPLDKAAVNIAKGVTAAKVSFRVFTALKQFLSMPAYLPDANPLHLAANIANPVGAWKWSMQNLPLFKKRWKSRMAGDPRLMKTDMDWKAWRNNAVQIASRLGMSPNAFVDALTVSIGAHSMYQTKKAKYLRWGMSDEDADRRAKQDATILFNQTQQSSEGAFLSTMQVDRSWLSVLFTVFRNSSMSYTRQLYDAMRNLGRYVKPGYADLSEEFMAKQMQRDGIDPDTADKEAKREYRNGILRNLARIGVFGYALQLAWNLGAYLPYLILGEDEDEKNKMWDDAMNHAIFGSVEGLTAGDVWSALGNQALQDEISLRGLAKDMPATSDLEAIIEKWNKDEVSAMNDVINLMVQSGIGVNPQTLTDAVVAVMDYCGPDAGSQRECALLIARILNCPQSQLDKVYFDEIDASAREASQMTPSQIARRYADYKIRRSAPLTGGLYSEEQRDSISKKRMKKVLDIAKEKIEAETDRRTGVSTASLDAQYKSLDMKSRSLSQIEGEDERKDAREDWRETKEYRKYRVLKAYRKEVGELTELWLKADDLAEKQQATDAIINLKKRLIRMASKDDWDLDEWKDAS